ncbi:MAG: HAMP domain-containing histidine kinase [Bacteroidales bacterium]|nr:HAMP domain-containing histidine kinase [Bacteroidales bacterium]
MFWKSLFKKDKKTRRKSQQASYESVIGFVDDNLGDVKRLLSSIGYNDHLRRLNDLADELHCSVVVLCQKLGGNNKFAVVESSNKEMCPKGTQFSWSHSLPTASADAKTVIDQLPFEVPGGIGFISAPVKNERNILAGVLIGISAEKLTDIDSKTRLLHLMAPFFEAEIRCAKLKQDARQYEQRIASLNQNIEVMNSDLRNEQERSVENKELRSIFLTNLSHEIRTPMNVIVGFCDLLESAETEEDRKRFTEIIKQNSQLLLDVIDNLVEISKLQSFYMQKVACPVQLNELLNKIKVKYEEKLQKERKPVEIETNYGLATPNDTIWNSDEIITKVMEQIMDNATKYTHTGKISISYTVNHREAIFCVTDTGSGIKPGTEESIFEMFSSDAEQNFEYGSPHVKGIGLAIAKKYLTLANGRIWVDPSYKDGACFYFSIPTEKL